MSKCGGYDLPTGINGGPLIKITDSSGVYGYLILIDSSGKLNKSYVASLLYGSIHGSWCPFTTS